MAITPGGDQAEAANGTNGAQASAVCSLETFLQQQFTYIICGGGTAGLAIATRLTEDPNVTVGVLEAGADRRGDIMVDIPALFLRMFGKEEYDWRYKTTPQVSSSCFSCSADLFQSLLTSSFRRRTEELCIICREARSWVARLRSTT
jgi:hypothetical protein